MKLDNYIILIFILYTSIIFLPLEYLGYLESLIRLITLVFFLNTKYLRNPFILFISFYNLLGILLGISFAKSILILFDFTIPFLILSDLKSSKYRHLGINVIRLITLIVITHFIISQLMVLDTVYYPYSDVITMGAFRNKAIYSVCFILYFYLWIINEQNKRVKLIDAILISSIGFIIFFSFRRTAWVISLIALLQLISWTNIKKIGPQILIIFIPILIVFRADLFEYFNILLKQRNTDYLFTIDNRQWRVQEILFHINDIISSPLSALLGNYINDPNGADFWGRFNVLNFIHVDFIRLAYYFGYIGLTIYMLTLNKIFIKFSGVKNFKFYLIIYYSIFLFSGGVLVHLFNTIIFFSLLAAMNRHGKL